jgi:hypothetical protein
MANGWQVNQWEARIIAEDGRIKCRRCDEFKPASEFDKRSNYPPGHPLELSAHCKECRRRWVRAYKARPDIRAKDNEKAKERYREHGYKQRERQKQNYDPDRNRNDILKRKYGIALSVYKDMLERQNGKCGICLQPQPDNGFSLAVDHCHGSGRIRGLLCANCNRGLGSFEDNRDFLFSAVRYLTKNGERPD